MSEKTRYQKLILYVFLLFLFVFANNAYSQEQEYTWKFSSWEQCVGNVVKFKKLEWNDNCNSVFKDVFCNNTFVKKGKKYKPLSKFKNKNKNEDELYVAKSEKNVELESYDLSRLDEFACLKVIDNKKKQYLQCVCKNSFVTGEDTVYFAMNTESESLLKYFTNKTFFENLLVQLKRKFAYYDIGSYKIDDYYKKIKENKGLAIYRKFVSVDWKMEYCVDTNVYRYYYRVPLMDWLPFEISQQINSDTIMENFWSIANEFVSKKKVKDYLPIYNEILRREEEERKRKQAIADSITDHTLLTAELAYVVDTIAADTIFSDDVEYKLDNDDKVHADYPYGGIFFVYKCVGDSCYCISLSGDLILKEVVMDKKNLTFSDDELYYKIKARGESGVDIRKELCKNQAKIEKESQKKLNEEFCKKILEKQKIYDNIMNRQLFLFGYNYGTNDYNKIYADFEIFNCFRKVIKYVKVTLRPYNIVGDIQRDYFGCTTKTLTMIGFIEPEKSAKCRFDDIFYDHYDIIETLRISNITFIFSDGTKKVFTGWNNIYNHWDIDRSYEELRSGSLFW